MLSGLGVFDPLLFLFPLWLVGLILIAAALLAREVGARLFRRVAARHPEAAEKAADDMQAQIVGAIFGLLAFIIGFTLSMALERYETRRILVAEEANAISTTYLRASLFDEPMRSQLQSTMREYARTRTAGPGVWDREMEVRMQETRALRDKLWDETRTALYPIRATEQASYFVDTMNNMLDLGNMRELAGRAHIPTRIFDVLLLYLLIASGMLGYVVEARKRGHYKSSILMVVLFVIVITLILDVDRPQDGSIRVPQTAIDELVAALDRDAARNPPPALAPPVGR